MTQITIRGIDPEIEKEIRKRAVESGQSINSIVLGMLQKNTARKTVPRANSLKKLAGGWNRKDALRFKDSVKIFEQIDEDMWR